MNRFIDHYKDAGVDTKYSAGIVRKYENEFIIAYEMKGASETFSIGQPVFDKDKNIMGYLGISFYKHLDYSTEGLIRIPVENWTICLPTEYCIDGKKVYTYWQMLEQMEVTESASKNPDQE